MTTRRALFLGGAIVVIAAVVATLNGLVDPKNEFYAGDALTAAERSHCLLANDVVEPPSYAEFKRDLFRRSRSNRVVVGTNLRRSRAVNLGFPGFGPAAMLDTMQFLAQTTQLNTRLTVLVATDPAWFDPHARLAEVHEGFLSKVGYLLSPWTIASTLDLMRRSRRLAFTGWTIQPAGTTCVVNRGSLRPAWRLDGTLVGGPESQESGGRGFAWSRLTAVDKALAIAQARGWRVVGLSTRAGEAVAYERELKALFASHGYRWRVRRIAA